MLRWEAVIVLDEDVGVFLGPDAVNYFGNCSNQLKKGLGFAFDT